MPSSSALGKIYGLVKVQKKDNPFRPVVSTVGSPVYKLAIKFLDKIIEHYIPNNYMLGVNYNDFISKLNQFYFSSNHKVRS